MTGSTHDVEDTIAARVKIAKLARDAARDLDLAGRAEGAPFDILVNRFADAFFERLLNYFGSRDCLLEGDALVLLDAAVT